MRATVFSHRIALLVAILPACAAPLPPIAWPDAASACQPPTLPSAGTVERYSASIRGVHAADAELRFLASDDPTVLLTQLHFHTVRVFATIYPLSETITVSTDAWSLRPRSVTVESATRSEVLSHRLHFDDHIGAVALLADQGDEEQRITLYGVEPWEPLSLGLRLRDLDTLDDFCDSFELLLGARMHRVELEVVGQEMLDGQGSSAWHLHGQVQAVSRGDGPLPEPTGFDAWIGVAPDRPLLRLDIPTDLGLLTLTRT